MGLADGLRGVAVEKRPVQPQFYFIQRGNVAARQGDTGGVISVVKKPLIIWQNAGRDIENLVDCAIMKHKMEKLAQIYL